MPLRERKLPIQAEKVLLHPIRPHLLAYCSRTDLFAVVTGEEVVNVFRLGGQRAFSVKRKSASNTVVGIEWIRNGKCLAIALSNGNVDIVSGETGKIVRHGGDDPFTTDASGSKPSSGAITCLGWGTTLTGNVSARTTDSRDAKQSISNGRDEPSTEDWYDELHGDAAGTTDKDSHTRDTMLNDLPRQLAFIDVESVLPRLSPIPVRANAGGRYDMFATQAALDDYFNSLQRKDRLTADVMLIGHQGGRVRLVIDDILEVGLSSADNEEDIGASKEHLLYRSHPKSPYHALLHAEPTQEDDKTGGKIYQRPFLSLFDIPLLSSGGSHLHLIVSRTAQVRDLCSYISYSIICAKSDWSTYTNLPSRFMENINETLEEKGEGTLEQNLFHLAMTGNFSPTILEWLKDELAERGHKRWDHAIGTLYTDLQKLLQTNLLPALERSILVVTNLRGLATYYEGSKKFDVPPSSFTAIISALGMLQLLVHEAIQILGEEMRQFRAWSRWLRFVIDLAAADPESVSAKDMAEREAGVLDYPRILAYLEGGMINSRLKPIVFTQTEGEVSEINQTALVEAIHQARKGKEARSELLSLHTLSTHLNTVCKAAHLQILRWQNSARPSIKEIDLNLDDVSSILDMRVIHQQDTLFETTILTVPASATNKMTLTSLAHPSPSSPALDPTPTTHTLTLPQTTNILALKILTDTTFLALLSLKQTHHHLLRLPLDSATLPQSLNEKDMMEYVIHSFEPKGAFVPVDMVVGNKVGGMNVSVVAQGGRAWRVLDLEEGIEVDGEEEGEDGKGEFIEDSDEEEDVVE